jgi:hypothetical protein
MMRGDFIGVWSETWREIWSKLARSPDAPSDVFCELYRELVPALQAQPTVEALADIVDDPAQARVAFRKIKAKHLNGELALLAFLEGAYSVLEDIGGDALANRYYNLLASFIERFSLRYDLRRPCTLCPTLPGVFASLIRDLRSLTSQDAHLHGLMRDFEDSVRDLRGDRGDGRIKTCIQKQINLLEALGERCTGVTHNTLGDICKQIGNWPHTSVSASLGNLYGFASNYPGIRHGGNPRGVLRDIDMRDLIAISVLLAGYTPYFFDTYNADMVYGMT